VAVAARWMAINSNTYQSGSPGNGLGAKRGFRAQFQGSHRLAPCGMHTESRVGRASIGLGQSRAALLRALAGGFDEGRGAVSGYVDELVH
jgi:hypothetical protein